MPDCAQIAMGTFVSYFFSGFILGKIPFPLSPSFRLMLQARAPQLPKTLHAHTRHLASVAHALQHLECHSESCCCRPRLGLPGTTAPCVASFVQERCAPCRESCQVSMRADLGAIITCPEMGALPVCGSAAWTCPRWT